MLGDLTLIDWLGVLGSFMIAGAYLAVSWGWVNAEHVPFNLANLIGSALILLSLVYRPNAGAIMIEVLWMLIALMALSRYVLRRIRHRPERPF